MFFLNVSQDDWYPLFWKFILYTWRSEVQKHFFYRARLWWRKLDWFARCDILSFCMEWKWLGWQKKWVSHFDVINMDHLPCVSLVRGMVFAFQDAWLQWSHENWHFHLDIRRCSRWYMVERKLSYYSMLIYFTAKHSLILMQIFLKFSIEKNASCKALDWTLINLVNLAFYGMTIRLCGLCIYCFFFSFVRFEWFNLGKGLAQFITRRKLHEWEEKKLHTSPDKLSLGLVELINMQKWGSGIWRDVTTS